MREDPLLKRRVEAAEDRENQWIVSQHEREEAKKAEKPTVARSSEPAAIPVTYDVPHDDAAGEVVVEIPSEETEDFYMEVNDDLGESISAEMMEEIDKLDEGPELSYQIGQLINESMRKVLMTHRPAKMDASHWSLNALRSASAMGHPHISEVYSPPRVCTVAERFGLQPGFSLDLTVLDSDGSP